MGFRGGARAGSRRARGPSLAALLVLLSSGCGNSSAHPPPMATPDDGGAQADGARTEPDGGAADAPFEASSEASAPDGGGPDAGAQADASDGSSGPTVCNTLTAAGQLVPQAAPGGPLPTAAGGTIALGTYWLTERDTYGSISDDLFVQRSLVIDSAKIDIVEGSATSDDAGAPPTTTRTATYQVFSTIGLSMRETCPGSQVTNAHYTATPTQLSIYYVDLGTAEIYTLQ